MIFIPYVVGSDTMNKSSFVTVDVVLSDILMRIGRNTTTQDQSQERHDAF
jgi:hypothetical protein